MVDQQRGEVSLERLVMELETVLTDSDEATLVVRRAGFPPGSLHKFTMGASFWAKVVEEASHGRNPGGVRALVTEASKLYPGNPVFAAFLATGAPGQPPDAESSSTGTELGWNDEREHVHPFPGHHARPHDSRPLPELVVIGRRERDWVRLSYRTARHTEPFEDRVLAWAPALDDVDAVLRRGDGEALLALGLQLGHLLLGGLHDPEHHAVMREVFGARAPDEAITALAGAVRCRLVLDEALAALPWRLCAVQTADDTPVWLTDEGWIFEHGPAEPSRHDVPSRERHRILFVVPRHRRLRVAGTALVERAVGQLEAMWPRERKGLGRLVAVAHGPDEVERALAEHSPHVVVVFGRALVEPEPSLELWRDDGASEPVPLTRLVEMLAAAKVEVLVLATTNAVPLPAEAGGRLPCVLVPTLPAAAPEVVDAVLSWLDAMLGEGLDPVRALHRPPASGPSRRWAAMQAHAAFRSWTVLPARAVADDKRARHRLDRDELRALFIRHVDDLVKDERRVLEAFVIHGEAEDQVQWLGEQLWEEYRDREPAWKASCKKRMPFPRDGERGSLDRRFDSSVKERLELDEGPTPRDVLEADARGHGWPEQPFVLWLDWVAQTKGITAGPLRAWIGLVTRVLPRLCEGLANVRVIATLGVVPRDRTRFHGWVDRLVKEETKERPVRSATVTVLDALGVVTARHVERYLEDAGRCPAELIPAVAEELVRRTGGAFARVVELIETLERTHGWRALAESRPEPEPEPMLDDDEEL